jgi:cytochrome P450
MSRTNTTDAPRCPFVGGRPFDPLSLDAAVDPYPWLNAARRQVPVFYLPQLDAWCVTRHDDIREVLRDTVRFSNAHANRSRKMSPTLREAYPNGHPGRHSMFLKDRRITPASASSSTRRSRPASWPNTSR